MLAVSALTALIIFYTPAYADDIWFRMPRGTEGVSWNDFVETVQTYRIIHWHIDANRLANHISPIFLCLTPRWLYALLCGIMMWFMQMLCCRLARCARGSCPAFVILGCMAFLLPWDEAMYCVMFSLNYMWSSVLVLLTLGFILAMERGKEFSRAQTAGICLLAVAAGWMHEGMSAPLAAGLGAYFLIMRRNADRRALAVAACFCIGLLLIMCGPAIWNRSATLSSVPAHGRGIIPETARFILYNNAFCLYAVCLAMAGLCRAWRQRLSRQDVAFLAMLFVMGMAASVFFIKFFVGVRVVWINQLLCPVGCVYLLRRAGVHPGRVLRSAIIVFVAVTVVTSYAFAAVEQQRLYGECRQVMQLFRESDSGRIYLDITQPGISPSMGKTSGKILHEKWTRDYYSTFYEDGKKRLVILPESFRDFTAGKARKVASTDSLMVFDNHIVTPFCPAQETLTLKVKTAGSDKWQTVKRTHEPFTASDGTKWWILEPVITKMKMNRINGKIADIQIDDAIGN